MIIICLATDQSEAHMGLYKDSKLLKEVRWQAHRELSNTFYDKLRLLLKAQKLAIDDIEGFVCYKVEFVWGFNWPVGRRLSFCRVAPCCVF